MKDHKDYYKFIHGYNNEEFKIECTFHNKIAIDDILEDFKQFLLGCGFGEANVNRIQFIERE